MITKMINSALAMVNLIESASPGISVDNFW